MRPLAYVFLLSTAVAGAQTDTRWEVRLESGAVWIPKSNIIRPNPGGTQYSFPALGGDGPFIHGRLTAYYGVGRGQRIRLVYAPLDRSVNTVLGSPIVFDGATFGPGPAAADFKFSNYRASYLWPFRTGRLSAEYGITLFVRDARIALKQPGLERSFSNVGVVPLLHLGGRYDAGKGWGAILDLDALEAPQGRVYDLGLQATYRLTRAAEAAVGFRYLSGSANNERVFNSAAFSYVTAGVNFRF